MPISAGQSPSSTIRCVFTVHELFGARDGKRDASKRQHIAAYTITRTLVCMIGMHYRL